MPAATAPRQHQALQPGAMAGKSDLLRPGAHLCHHLNALPWQGKCRMVWRSDSRGASAYRDGIGSRRAGRGGLSLPGQLVSAGEGKCAQSAQRSRRFGAAGLAAGSARGCAGGADGHQLHHPVPGRRRLQAAGLRRPVRRRAARGPRRVLRRRLAPAGIAPSIAPLAGLARPEFDDEMKAEEANNARPSTSAW